MDDIALRVCGLGKRYRLTGGDSFPRLSATVSGMFSSAFRRGMRGQKRQTNEFWALRDVSFEINHGQAVGIVGRNGAGKSTLLKIISRVTEMTEGSIDVFGRIGGLLEVGTGFHPELTARENIFLNGAILGMKRAEIRSKFDEIVDFAEVETFLDMPVKRFSSGMYTRLAFAVAAHLDPNILVVDEVLAVGDAQFQKKCLGKMRDVTNQGRTVLFVSHNMAAVATLCQRAMLLKDGHLIEDGDVATIVDRYVEISKSSADGQKQWPDVSSAPGTTKVRLRAITLMSEGKCTNDIEIDLSSEINVQYQCLVDGLHLSTEMRLMHRTGICAFSSRTTDQRHGLGLFNARFVIPENLLNDGLYSVSISIYLDVTDVQIELEQAIAFLVHDHGPRVDFTGSIAGMVRPKLFTEVTQLVDSPLISGSDAHQQLSRVQE